MADLSLTTIQEETIARVNSTKRPSLLIEWREAATDSAASVFFETQAFVQNNLSASQKDQKRRWVIICAIAIVFGIALCLTMFNGRDSSAAVPIVLLLFVVFPSVFMYMWLRVFWMRMNPPMAAKKMGELFDDRVKVILFKKKKLLGKFEPAAGEERASLITSLFPNIEGFRALQVAGYASLPAWATYAAAWRDFLQNVDPVQKKNFEKLHDSWLDVLSRITPVISELTQVLDQDRIKAWKLINRRGLASEDGLEAEQTDAEDNLEFKLVESNLEQVNDSLTQIKADIAKIKQSFKEVGVDTGFVMQNHQEIHPIHPIPRKRLVYGAGAILGFCVLPLISFAAFGSGLAALLMVIAALVLAGIFIWRNNTNNKAYNNMEDLLDCEYALRLILDKLMVQQFLEDDGVDADPIMRTTVLMLTSLRQELMDNYTSALKIHLETEMLLYRPIPYPGIPQPLTTAHASTYESILTEDETIVRGMEKPEDATNSTVDEDDGKPTEF